MLGSCPAPGPDDPLVRGLLMMVDCNVQNLVRSGYDSLFAPSAAFADVLTALLVIWVALLGYRLLLGRAGLEVGEFALSAVKIGAVLALATRWGAYQTLVYHFLYFAPQQIADVMVHRFAAGGSAFGGDVYDGLQRAFVDLTAFSPAAPPGGLAATTPANSALAGLLSRAGWDSLMLLGSAVILLLASLGVLLASKIVLGMLLAAGPLFIAFLLFEATRGVFEGWLRAVIAMAFIPLGVILMLGLALTMLEPLLLQLEAMRQSNSYQPGVAFGVMVLSMVFAGVALAMVAAAGLIASGARVPWRPRRVERSVEARTAPTPAHAEALAFRPRSARVAEALRVRQNRAPLAAREALAAPTLETTGARPLQGRGPVWRPEETSLIPPSVGIRRGAAPRAARSGPRSLKP